MPAPSPKAPADDRPDTPPGRTEGGPGRPGRRTPLLVAAVVAVVALLGGAIALVSGGGGDGTPAEAPVGSAAARSRNTTKAAFDVRTLAGAPHLGDEGPATSAVLVEPSGVAQGPDGSVYVSDDVTNRVRRIRPDGTITTVAGTGAPGFDGDAAPGLVARLNQPQQLAADAAGNVYVADAGNHRIRRITPDGTITTVAGTGVAGTAGDGGPARSAQLASPFAVAVAGPDVLVVADTGNRLVRRIAADGTIATIAGNGQPGTGGDGGQAVDAQLIEPTGVAVTDDGALLIADRTAGTVRRVTRDGVIDTIAYTPQALAAGVAAPPGAAALTARPFAVTVTADGRVAVAEPTADRVEVVAAEPAAAGAAAAPEVLAGEGIRSPRALVATPERLLVADTGNRRVVAVRASGAPQTVAGSGQWDVAQAGATARDLWLLRPGGVAVAGRGADEATYVADGAGNVVWRVAPDGSVTRVAGTGLAGFSGDGGPATAARLSNPQGLAVAEDGALLVADTNNLRVRRVAPDGTISTVLGNGAIPAAAPPEGTTATATAVAPVHVAAHEGAIAVTEPQLGRVLLVRPDGTVHTVAGQAGAAVPLGVPAAVTFDPAGTLFVADATGNRVLRVTTPASVPALTVLAGTGEPGFDGERGGAQTAKFSSPQGLLALGTDDVVVADTGNNRLRRVFRGAVTTVAGNGQPGGGGDGLKATEGRLGGPSTLALRGDGSALVLQADLGIVRTLTEDGTLGTFAGTGALGRIGDRGPATAASLASPTGVAVAPDGSVYVSDTNHHRVRKIGTDGRIRTVVGTGVPGSAGLGRAGTAAELAFPQGVALAPDGRLFVADTANHRVVVLTTDGKLQAFAGSGVSGDANDSSVAVEAKLTNPLGVAVGADGRVFVSDAGTGKVLAVEVDGSMRTLVSGLRRPNGLAVDAVGRGHLWIAVEGAHQLLRLALDDVKPQVAAGTGTMGFEGDGGPATAAAFASPASLAVTADGTAYVTDGLNARIRRISPDGTVTSVAGSGSVGRGADEVRSEDATFALPLGIAIRPSDGALVVADTFNDRVRLLLPRS